MNWNELFSRYQAVLFDLDNTLYSEVDYLFGAYDFIGSGIHKIQPELDGSKLSDFLKETFLKQGRSGLFEKLISTYGLSDDYKLWMLNALREVKFEQKLSLFSDSFEILNCALHHAEVFIVTNGNVTQQVNKVNQIEWHGLLDKINVIYAEATLPKPAPDSFLSLNIPGNWKCIYIGDADTDYDYARNCQMDFLHVSQFRDITRNF